jgi:hypothetical protein
MAGIWSRSNSCSGTRRSRPNFHFRCQYWVACRVAALRSATECAVDPGSNKYWIAAPGDWSEYPSPEALDDVFLQPPDGAGVAPSDFFQGLAGWGFAKSTVGNCQWLTITITNQTPNPLTVKASPSSEVGGRSSDQPHRHYSHMECFLHWAI